MPFPATWLGQTLDTRNTRLRWPAITRPMNSSEPYTSAVSISVIPSERPVRSASSSSASGCLPFARPAEPWPNAETTVPSRNFTVCPAPVEATPLAASRADAPDEVTNELSATQSPLNSRRFSGLVSLPFTMRSLPLRRSCSVVNMVQPVVLLGGCVRLENLHRFKVATEEDGRPYRWRQSLGSSSDDICP